MGFSENLLKMRKQRGWTQMDLAKQNRTMRG